MKLLFVIASFLFCAPSRADDTSLVINLMAHHWDRKFTKSHNLNERNPGIGIDFDDGEFRKSIGFYKNSHYKTSIYASYCYFPIQSEHIKLGVSGGIVTGYFKPIIPTAGLVASVNYDKVGLNVIAVPSVSIGGHKSHGFAGFQMSYKF